MRHMISGMIAAIAVMATAPAMACGYGVGYCGAPVVNYGYTAGGCGTGCGGWATERLADPVQQYYYVNQGPTFTGAGNWAPAPTYQEAAVGGWNAYSRPYYYGYNGGRYANATNHTYDGMGVGGPRVYTYRGPRAYRGLRPRANYFHGPRVSYRYGHAPRHVARYAPYQHPRAMRRAY